MGSHSAVTAPASVEARIQAHGVEVIYHPSDPPAVTEASLHVGEGEWVGLIGPNGSGKSTFVRALSRVLTPRRGVVLVDGLPVQEYPRDGLARRLAVVSQEAPVSFDFTVREVVAMGRMPHLRPFQTEGPADWAAVERAMELTRTESLADRLLSQLSGGERQRVAIARALAQEPRILMLDEPTAHLDIGYQIELLDLLTALVHREGLSVLSVVHDLNLAAQYCHRLVLMQEGRMVAVGDPDSVLTEERIRAVYGVDVQVGRHPVADVPCVHLLSRISPPRREPPSGRNTNGLRAP